MNHKALYAALMMIVENNHHFSIESLADYLVIPLVKLRLTLIF